MQGARSSPVAVAAVVLLLYAGWVGWARHLGHDWRQWADVGHKFAQREGASDPIHHDERFSVSTWGYDGQFFLYIAQDPTNARAALDNASYRYGRIGYPIAARVLALGRSGLVPVMLVLLNLAAVAGGTWAAAAWLRRRGLSVWLALLYAAFPGVFFAVWRDLSETLAYSLAAVAVLVFDPRRPRTLAASSVLFAAAALTRETTLVFALVWAAALAVERRPRTAALFTLGATLPYVAWRVFIRVWLGHAGFPAQNRPTLVPFGGIMHWFPWRRGAPARLQRVPPRSLLRGARRVRAVPRRARARGLGVAAERARSRGLPAGRRIQRLEVGGPPFHGRRTRPTPQPAGARPRPAHLACVALGTRRGVVRPVVRTDSDHPRDALGLAAPRPCRRLTQALPSACEAVTLRKHAAGITGRTPTVSDLGGSIMRGRLIFLAAVAALVVAATATAAQLDLIRGTNGPDELNGTPGSDLIYARAGNDVVRAHDGNDVVYAGPGNDVVRGGLGNDVEFGGHGNDVLWVGAGADVQYGGPGNDVLHALANDNQPDVLNCGPGYDVAYVVEHDPVRVHGCEQVIRLSLDEAASLAQTNDDNG